MEFYDPSDLRNIVFKKISEFEILAYALDLEINHLVSIIDNNHRLYNPFFRTKNPSMSFSLRVRGDNTKYIYCKDFANDRYSGDCLALLGVKLRLDCNTKQGFIQILKYILAHESEFVKVFDIPKDLYDNIEKSYTIKYREFTNVDFNYFNSFNLNIVDFTGIDYRAIQSIYDNILRKYVYMFRSTNLAYSYITNMEFNNVSMKLYFPLNKIVKFKTINGSSIIEDPYLFKPINKGKRLIITKSRKDKLILTKHLKSLNVHNFYVTHVSSETAIFDDYITELYSFFEDIHTFYDLDKTGVSMSIRYRKLGIPTLLPNHGTITIPDRFLNTRMLKVKDYAELVNYNKDLALTILNLIIQQI